MYLVLKVFSQVLHFQTSFTYLMKVVNYQNRLLRDSMGPVSAGALILDWMRPSAHWPCFELGGSGNSGQNYLQRSRPSYYYNYCASFLERNGNCFETEYLFCQFDSIY